MFLQSVTVKKINYPKLPTEQSMLRGHMIGYGAPTARNTCGFFSGIPA